MNLAAKTGRNINNLVKWTILTVPQRLGVTWFRLGKEPRNPFHLHFSTDEAEELLEIAIKLDKTALVRMELGMEVNLSETQELITKLTPILKTSDKTGALIFFQELEADQSDSDSEGSSAPSREDMTTLVWSLKH